jgi:hypothetical protein
MAKDEGSEDARGVYMIRSRLNGWDNHFDTVDKRLLNWIDSQIETKRFASQSHVVEYCVCYLMEEESEG